MIKAGMSCGFCDAKSSNYLTRRYITATELGKLTIQCLATGFTVDSLKSEIGHTLLSTLRQVYFRLRSNVPRHV